jgi:diguanylate cyclase (GGDEF)-like protein
VQRCDDATADERVDRDACQAVGALSMLCVPLRHRGEPVGVLKVYAARTHAFDDADATLLDSLSGVIAAHMAHAAEFERRFYESRHDALTDIGNRRAYDERLDKEVARSERYGHALSLVLLDLDGFKSVNDADGHPAGDEVLRRVGGVLRGVRRTDDCFRTGGDEFALLLPDTPVAGARIVATRVCAEIAGSSSAAARVGVGGGRGMGRRARRRRAARAADASLLDAKRRLHSRS